MPTLNDSRNVIKTNQGSMQTNGLVRPHSRASNFPLDISVDYLLKGKELSLISHIENLKRIANNEQAKHENVNNSGPELSTLPVLSNISIYGKDETIAPKTSSTSSSLGLWAIHPGSVPGNLRPEKCPSITLEDVYSRGSSVSEKQNEGKDGDFIPEKHILLSKGRKPRTKSSKKVSKKKDSSKHANHKSHDLKNGSVSLNIVTKSVPATIKETESIDALSALCQTVTIHEKVAVPKKSVGHVNATNNHQIKNSPARTSLNNALVEYTKASHSRRKNSHTEEDASKATKVFLSEKQSGMISDCGGLIPCAPPATPTAEQLKKYEYIPSMQDIRSQRAFKQRLQLMETRASRKEKRKQDENQKLELLSMKEKRQEFKRHQRQEIYALNKIMTDLEHSRFQKFMASVGPQVS